MEHPEASYSSSMQKHLFGITSSRGRPECDRKAYAPFQAIIEKGKQAKAQVELDQYEARKAKRETDIKTAARIRHAEAEANRRRAEESKSSIDDHKGKLLDAMTNNIKAILEDQYREEIREKVYGDEDKIISAYEHDVKDQTKARLVRELESVVKAKLGAQFEPEVKQQLAVELVSVVRAELRAEYETEVKQQLVKELGPEVEAELRAKYETEVRSQLAEELRLRVKAELRAKYEEETKNQLMMSPTGPAIVQKLNGTHTNDVENETEGQRDALHNLDGESFRAAPNDIDSNESENPDLSRHPYLMNQNGVQNGQQEVVSVQKLENLNTDGDGVKIPHGTKRSLGGEDNEDEDPYARHSKRSRSASFNDQEQPSLSSYQNGVVNLYSSYSLVQQPYQSVSYRGAENQGFPKYDGNAGHKDAQGNNGFEMEKGAPDYNSSDEVPGSHGIIMERGGADYNSAEDTQSMNGGFLDRDGVDDDSTEDFQDKNGNCLNGEEPGYDSAEEFEGSSGYKSDGEATASIDGEDEDEEDYESEEEEQYSTAPHATSYPNVGDGVITYSNTQDTAFVLSDSEDDGDQADDEDKTLVGYENPAPLNDTKQCKVPAEESPFPNP